jgi:hypothetical protein
MNSVKDEQAEVIVLLAGAEADITGIIMKNAKFSLKIWD